MAKVRVAPPRLTVPLEPKLIKEDAPVLPVADAITMVFASVIELIVVALMLPPLTVMPAARPAVLETSKVVVLPLARPERMVPPNVATAPKLFPAAVTLPPKTKVPPAKLTLGPEPPVLLNTRPPTA